MSTPHSNVDLLQLAGPDAAGEDWDDSDAPGAPLWSGSVGAYLRQNEDRVRSQGRADVLMRRTLKVMARDFVGIAFKPGQTLKWRSRLTGEDETGTVKGVGRPQAPPGFAHIATVELILDPA